MPPTRRWPFRFTNPASAASAQNFLVQICIGAGEGDIHRAAVTVLDGVVVEVLAVQIIVEDFCLGLVDLLHLGEAADVILQILEHQTGHVDAPAGRGVVHAVLVQQGGVVHHGGHIVRCFAQQIVPDDGNGHTGGCDILLDTKIAASVLGHIHGLGKDHGAHIRHQRHALHLRQLDVLGAEDGVILADVDVACVLIIRDNVHIWDVGKIFILAGGHDLGFAKLGGFLWRPDWRSCRSRYSPPCPWS